MRRVFSCLGENVVYNTTMEKDFDRWHALKSWLHQQHNQPTFQEREVWWCSIGLNVGHEEDGKNDYFNRPVLILRKFNKQLFWGVPLTTRIKESPHYYIIDFRSKKQCVMLTHLRLYDSKRLTHKAGKIGSGQFRSVRNALADRLYIK